jgi:hypothetical protein
MIIMFIIAMTVAYQANTPCDDACFRAKIGQEVSTETRANPNDNSWRYLHRQ